MTTRLIEIVQRLGHPRIFVIGDVMLDRYIWGQVHRISPEAPIPVLNVHSEEFRPGGAANVARNLAALEARVACCGTVGKDPFGESLKKLLRSERIGTAYLVEDTNKPTSTKTRIVAHSQQMLRVDRENVTMVQGAAEEALLAAVRRAAGKFDLAIVSDYHKGTLSPKVCRAVIQTLGAPVLVGLKSKDVRKYRGATGASLNRAELFTVTGLDRLESAARKLLRELGLRFLIVTLGEHGLTVFPRSGEVLRLPTVARQVYDVTGAGDTVLAAFGLAFASGVPLEDCARIANAAAGIVVGKVGTAVTSREEIVEHLVGGGHLTSRKIVDQQELLAALQRERRRGRTIVFTNGCFDLLHAGHVRLLQFAKSHGDVLVVGLNSDASVRRLKGDRRPIVPQEERAQVLAAIEAIDYVVVFDEDTPLRLIRKIRPDVLVKGEDWAGKTVVGGDVVSRNGGRVVLAPLVRGRSTTGIIERVLERFANDHE